MDASEVQLSLIYVGAFKDRNKWTEEDHLNGLKAVWHAGARAANKATTSAQLLLKESKNV